MIESKTGSRLRANPSTSTKALWSTKVGHVYVRGSSTASEDVSLGTLCCFITSIAGPHMLPWNQEPREEQIQIKTGWRCIFKDFRCTYVGMDEMGWNCMFIHRSFIIR
ncbi:hypothetical protein NC651_025943 [Populus alba x Populus x berolinensis]|nr:hypothetical protein NC651_025943 [Populus alba x Populus x berolinensis]